MLAPSNLTSAAETHPLRGPQSHARRDDQSVGAHQTAPGASCRCTWLSLAGVTALAFLLRLVYLSQLSGSPVIAAVIGDSLQYDAWAQRIAGGDWIGSEVFYQTPLYPYALALLYSVTGHDLQAVRLAQAVLGSVSCGLVGLAGWRFFSNRVGVTAALLLALYPPAIFFDGLIQKSSLDLFLLTALLVLLGEFRARRDWKWIAAVGITAAAFVLNRENGRVFFPVIAAWLLLDFRGVPLRRRAGWLAVFCVAFAVVLVPVGLRNYWVGGEFLVSTSQLGPNFYIGNNPGASGSYNALVLGRGDAKYEREDATRLASAAMGRPLTPAEVSDYWLRRSFHYVLTQPFQWLKLLLKKVLLTINAAELPDTESIEAYADFAPMLRALLWLDFGVVLPLAVLGVWAWRTQWRSQIVLYGMLAGLVMTIAAFYVLARYRYPIVPLVLLFAAAGLMAVLNRRVNGAGGIVLAGLAAIVANLHFDVAPDQTYRNLGSYMILNRRPADAVPLLLKAVAIDPDRADPHFALGYAYQETGQLEAAVNEYSTAIRLRPDDATAYNTLGLLLLRLGKTAEAMSHFREAARRAPLAAEAHSNLGSTLMRSGQLQEAIAELRSAVALAPRLAKARNDLALALAAAEEHDAAVAQFQEAVRLTPDDYTVRLNFAKVLCDARDSGGCIEQYEEAARLSPGSEETQRIAEALERHRAVRARGSPK